MEESQININPTIFVAALVSVILVMKIIVKSSTTGKKVPPSPRKLPIIGNLHQLVGSTLFHQELHSLAQKHGPLMLLHLGSVPFLVVSSAEWARQVIKTHDLSFASRPAFKGLRTLIYDCTDVASAPYGEYWKKAKSILLLHLLSKKRVQASRSLAREETALLVEKIRESCGAAVNLNLSGMFAKLNNDVVCRSAFGRTYSESENGKKFLQLFPDVMELMASIDIGDFIPWLSWIGRVNGYHNRLDRVAKEMDQRLECIIQERLEARNRNPTQTNNEDTFLDLMLDIYNGDYHDFSIDRDNIKPLIFDIFVGGTDSTFATLEWAMAELLRHPTVMEKLQCEVRGIVKHDDITDDDLEKMHYLKAVIKEVFRCHPPLPLLVPRLVREDVQIKGYDISAGTIVMINAWAIGRDPASWEEPREFKPERFLNSSIDFKGQDFELIPFGGGRRGCPGITFALATIELLLANLMLRFEWKLQGGDGKDLDMIEAPGATAHKAVPLLAVASNYYIQ